MGSVSDAGWEPGQTAVLRYITRDERPGMCWPATVVRDQDDLLALYIPQGTIYKAWGIEDGERRLRDATWRRDVLRLMFPGRGHSVWLFWEAGEAGRRFTSYYVNLEEPFRRTTIGFDTNDHVLDIVVSPDLSWRWKDDDELAQRVAGGVYSGEFAEELRAEARRAIAAIEGQRSPYSDGWEAWQPEPEWDKPELPDTWRSVPPALWDRRRWAYLSTR